MKIRFILFHLIFLGAMYWVSPTIEVLVVGAVLYFVRMFGVTAGYHRYFSHRTFKTSRIFAFILACIAQSSAQRGVIWWASNHRHHHRFSDQAEDLHSPVVAGFWQSHVGWLWNPASYVYHKNITDLERCPELVFLNTYPMIPAIILGAGCWWVWDWAGLVYGFGLSTILLFHGTFTINSLTHMWGSRHYETTDQSRNNLWLALITLGEGWHNNHHRYMKSTRQGFLWWEIDITFYILWILSVCGIVWDLRPVPQNILDERI